MTQEHQPAGGADGTHAIAAEKLAEQLDHTRAKLLDERGVLTKRRDALRHEIESIRSLPIADNELCDLACQSVDAHAAAYHRGAAVTAGLDAYRRHRGEKANLRLLDAQKLGEDNALGKIALGMMGGPTAPTLQWFCFFFGDRLKARLRDAFDDEPPKGTTTIQQRREQIAKLQEQIDQLDAEIKQNEEVLVRLGHRFYGELGG